MEQTPNLSLPYILPSQAQKHVTHNEALDILDALVQLAVESVAATAPPATPAEGSRYVVAAGATGDWTGHDAAVAFFRDGGWQFATPSEGSLAWVRDAARLFVFAGGVWSPCEPVLPAALDVQTLGLNASASAATRLAVASAGTLLSHDGGSHRLVVNKASTVDTASLVLQNGFSGRAEIGLAGDDDLHLRISPDGVSWQDALVVAQPGGRILAPNGLAAPGHVLQIVSSRLTTEFTTTSSTPQPTGLQLSITPSSAGSRILIRASVVVGAEFWHTSPRLAVYRDGVKVWPSAGGVYLEHQLLADTEANSRLVGYSVPIEFEDQPATTQALTYEVRIASSFAGRNVHLNRRDLSAGLRGESNMSASEIG